LHCIVLISSYSWVFENCHLNEDLCNMKVFLADIR